MLKKTIVFLLAAFAGSTCTCKAAMAAGLPESSYNFVEASTLTMLGKLMDTPNPYHRVDTCRYGGFTRRENLQVRCPAGLAVLFRTDSPSITLKNVIGDNVSMPIMTELSTRGYDLYIRKDGKWLWAGSCTPKEVHSDRMTLIVKDMDSSMKDCMLYLPIYSEHYSLQIGTEKGTSIEAGDASLFRHRVAIYGSSFTHGACISRPGMSYPMVFMRETGIQLLNLGCGGNGKMQPQYVSVLKDVDADAFIFDVFSNPDAAMIRRRLPAFIESMRTAHPGVPLIFLRTVYRENRNFDTKLAAYEEGKQHVVDSLMRIAVRNDRDVYYVDIDDYTGHDHETTVDGTHPSDMGYRRWALALKKPVLKILRRYGLK